MVSEETDDLMAFQQDYRDKDTVELHETFEAFLIAEYAAGRRTVDGRDHDMAVFRGNRFIDDQQGAVQGVRGGHPIGGEHAAELDLARGVADHGAVVEDNLVRVNDLAVDDGGLHEGPIVQRVAVENQEVGVLAGLQRAEALLLVRRVGIRKCERVQRLGAGQRQQSEQHAEPQDRQRRAEAEVRNNADSIVYQTEKVLREQGDKVTAEEKEAVEQPLADLKKAMEGSDTEAIKAATDTLMSASQAFSQKLYEAAARDSGADGTSASNSARSSSRGVRFSSARASTAACRYSVLPSM